MVAIDEGTVVRFVVASAVAASLQLSTHLSRASEACPLLLLTLYGHFSRHNSRLSRMV